MRLLVACAACGRQYDASGATPGSRLRCACGETIVVPEPSPHDAAVVRCSSCGGPREKGRSACHFCGADFTLHERDLHTLCPGCGARVSDRARYCHHCATPIVPEGSAGKPTARGCPVCGTGATLNSRRFGSPPLAVAECPRCAGLWLSKGVFEVLIERARRLAGAVPDAVRSGGPTGRPAGPAAPRPAEAGPLYRPCPECGKLMHRRNYGRRSGIILDSCAAHGLWFDAEELDRVFHWVRAGGEETARRLRRDEDREAVRRARLARRLEPAPGELGAPARGGWVLLDVLGWLLGRILP